MQLMERDATFALELDETLWDGPRAHGNEKLVDVDDCDPETLPAERRKTLVVNGDLRPDTPAEDISHELRANVPVEKRQRIVSRVVVVKEKVLDADKKMILQPLDQVVRLVLERRETNKVVLLAVRRNTGLRHGNEEMVRPGNLGIEIGHKSGRDAQKDEKRQKCSQQDVREHQNLPEAET